MTLSSFEDVVASFQTAGAHHGAGTREYRSSGRVPFRMPVMLCRRGSRLADGWSTNIALEGMFVAYDSSAEVENSLVEISFPLPADASNRVHRLSAIVAHVAPNGAGLMFLHFDREVFAAFQAILDGSSRALAGR